jgi:transposase
VGVKRRRFDPEFRAGAVRIVGGTGKPVAQVARDLGISEYTLHNWVKLDREHNGQGVGGVALNESEREELARLRKLKAEMAREHARQKAEWEKEKAELEMERDDAPMFVKLP